MRTLALQTFLYFITTLQMVHFGPPNPHLCDYLSDHPNLTLRAPAQLSGELTDQTGATFNGATVELHRFTSASQQPKRQTTRTDDHGHFVLTTVPPGRYRLIFPSAKGFLQPKELTCPPQGNCTLNITLKVESTDTPEAICPIR